MKKIFLFLLALVSCTTMQAQEVPEKNSGKMSDLDLGNYYLKKSKTLKTAAWVTLGVGLILSVAGEISYENSFWTESTSGAEAMMLTGTLATIASVPLFIAAARNKGRAEILLRHENVPIGIYRENRFSLGIALALGR